MNKMIISVVILIIAVIVVLPFILDNENQTLNYDSRMQFPGNFLNLPDGVTYCRIGGPEKGDKIVLIHGISASSFVWENTFLFLTKSGFRVLIYDIYGRGFSDRPDADYNIDLFDRQLAGLLDSLQWKEKVNIAGVSLGGTIALNFAVKHPERINKISLVSPYGFKQELPFVVRISMAPVIGDYIMKAFGYKIVLNKFKDNFNKPDNLDSININFEKQLPFKGYKRALLGTMRNFLSQDFSKLYEEAGKLGKPVILLWGKKDAVIPFEYSEKVMNAIPGAEFHAFNEAGHVPMLETSQNEVNKLLLEFFKRK